MTDITDSKVAALKLAGVLTIVVASVFLSIEASASTPPEAAACAACHGPGGKSTVALYPVLAGQHEAYIKKQLLDFKSGARKDPVMSAMAKPLTEKQIDTLAKYFSKQ
ncbi:c-type cytochrome [Agaribacterium haliotis]|uniref:c-type cytochrome n=1 Tax=Agaribacterium haliotis TaxID=2013869 RepID=UPI000BB542FE|nr:c-type cytochrome [Agaribacterium haliotis]